MDDKKIQAALTTWLAPETWHTGHQSDEQSFHRALHKAFSELQPNIASEQFESAIREVLKQKHPGHLKSRAEDIKKYAQRAEDIGSYLFDLE